METESRQAPADQADKEKIQVLETIVEKCTGTVKWYSHKLLYGFISRCDNNEDVFVHRSAISKSNLRSPNLRNGEEVEFSVVRTTNGIEACDVTGPQGAPVQGFVLVRRRRRGPRQGGDGETEANGEVTEKKQNGVATEGGDRPQRRRNRRRGPPNQNGEPNGNHSENEVYYEAENNASPTAGQPRVNRAKGGESQGSGDFKPRGRGGRGGGARGGFRGNFRRGFGGRGGVRGAKRGGAAPVESA